MPRNKSGPDIDPAPSLFDLDLYPLLKKEKVPKFVDMPLWTSAKARLIARYLRLFVFVTKHGTYIDCFAGPQAMGHTGSTWAARMVLESEPKFLRKFFLFEADDRKIPALQQLKKDHCKTWRNKGDRKVEVRHGDSNVEVPAFLRMHKIPSKQATFALLDQRTFECSWELVEFLARHKPGGNKIELFYFLAQGWIDRALSKLRTGNVQKLDRWWGGRGWSEFAKLKPHKRCEVFAERFKEELGYESALAFPIRKKSDSGRVMFWMIHATDHPVAPHLMVQAYNSTVLGKDLETEAELLLFAKAIKASTPELF